jgi:hypothetical protein
MKDPHTLNLLLGELGLSLPALGGDDGPSAADPPQNLLPWLAPDPSRDRQWSDWHRSAIASGACLTAAWPYAQADLVRDWLGDRLYWWPCGIPPDPLAGVVSSRLTLQLDQRPEWFCGLRMVCAMCGKTRRLVVCARTSAAEFVRRAARLFGTSTLEVRLADECGATLAQWWAQARANRQPQASGPEEAFVDISPPLAAATTDQTGALAQTPFRDRLLVAAPDELFVLHVRPRGNLECLVRERLKAQSGAPPTVRLALADTLVAERLRDQLLEAGAVGWAVLETAAAAERVPSARRAAARPWAIADWIGEPWRYLSHWTRRRHGPWPGQGRDGFLDDLILARPSSDHSAIAALKRILRDERLIASRRTVKGGVPVVSFTEVPLTEIPRRRVYRAHRKRWDFESYGMCIDRQWLESQGARPVIYLGSREGALLDLRDRPFVQLDRSITRSGREIDWTLEREWRYVGDLDLKELGEGLAAVFVPTWVEAEEIAAASRWPVVVLANSAGMD